MLILSSNPKNICRVEKFVEQACKDKNISPEKYGNILISLTEAVTNAILHGNNADESKSVEIRLEERKQTMAFYIKDEGQGFDYRDIPDPTKQENILRLGGRGVFLMRELSDKLKFHDNGRVVEINFKL